jgi:hypothetical protein
MPRGAPKAQLVAGLPSDSWESWESSNCVGGRWEADREGGDIGRLWLRFDNKSGRPASVYVYSEVPRRVWEGLRAAPSKGRFVAASVKGHFPYVGPIAAS